MGDHVSRVPWGIHPSLKDKTNELGVDFDRFIAELKKDSDDTEIAGKLEISEKVVADLRKHFEELGIQSIVGRD